MVQVINETFLARGVEGKLGIKYSVSVLRCLNTIFVSAGDQQRVLQ